MHSREYKLFELDSAVKNKAYNSSLEEENLKLKNTDKNLPSRKNIQSKTSCDQLILDKLNQQSKGINPLMYSFVTFEGKTSISKFYILFFN